MKYTTVIIISLFHYLFMPTQATNLISIDFQQSTTSLKKLKRFWTNTGFSPLEIDPKFFESTDLKINLEIIGSLPNNGLKNVRIHWLLDLLSINGYENDLPIYNFKVLDNFLDKLIFEYNLVPTIEFMTSLKFRKLNEKLWEDFAYKILDHYAEKFSPSRISKWKLETWNEPDLTGYNKQNFTLSEYQDYIKGIKTGLNRVSNKYSMRKKLKLRGPAGLFKDYSKHKFCWNVLENCNRNVSSCPIDVITFHRKGNGNDANGIIEGSLNLLREFSMKFPLLTVLKYSNSEADPIKKWSEPRDFQTDTRYAAILVETVLQHWAAIFDGRMELLESISHDNSFMNFYPNIFTQRTLLARFQINNTQPKQVQFVRKPVFTGLGLISNLGRFASNVRTTIGNISYLISINNRSASFFSCILLTSHVNNQISIKKSKIYEFEVKNLPKSEDLMYFVEAIDNKRTNPSEVYEKLGKPKYPDINDIQKMRAAEGPVHFGQPTKVVDGKIFVNVELTEPFVIAIRICSINLDGPKKVRNLRIRRINSEEIILFWNDSFYHERCIKSYEIFFKYYNGDDFRQIEAHYIPFLYHQFKHTIPGCFKIQSRDLFNRVSRFSKEICL